MLKMFIITLFLTTSAWLLFRHNSHSPARFLASLLMTATVASQGQPAPTNWQTLTGDQRLTNLHQRRDIDVMSTLKAKGFALGDAVFIRAMKESSELELWLKPKAEPTYKLYQTYRIAYFSGKLGPKTKQGDMQAPEGFYATTRKLMNPASTYHLSFNIGYPNAYDHALGRTGSLIMVHGKNVSVGCFAMTDPIIEEIYLIVDAALSAGQSEVPVHCFPFRMTEKRMATEKDNEWHAFWQKLKQGWDAFEQAHVPPSIP